VDRGATLIAIGIRSVGREEFFYGRETHRVATFTSQSLVEDPQAEKRFLESVSEIRGDTYLTIDIDALDVAYCPGTGTPQPGGLGWWQTLRYLRAFLFENRQHRFRGCDLVETVPQHGTQVNELVAARLLSKLIAYRMKPR
jgi:agmatinase